MANTLKIPQLQTLYRSMRTQDVQRAKFDYQFRHVVFNVIFFAEGSPWCLLFGARGHQFAFEIKVLPGFSAVCEIPPDDYRALCQLLELRYDPNNKFSITAFLREFAGSIPSHVTEDNKVEPHDVGRIKRNVEDADKIYFRSWRDNTVRGDQVSPENIEKTRWFLGEKIADSCQRRNISSCWTDDPDLAVKVGALP